MKNLITRLGITSLGLGALMLLAGVLGSTFPTPVSADNYGYLTNFIRQEPAGKAITAVSTDVTLLIKYVGAQSGTVTVAAGGDITFKEGLAGAETASTSFECPVSGALGGVITVANAACDTLGEVVDTINGACTGCVSTNWRAVILSGLRSDSSNDTLAALSETAATAAGGIGLLNDNAVSFNNTIALTDCRDFTCGYVTRGSVTAAPPMVENPWKGRKIVVWKDVATTTFGSGTSTFQIIDVDVHNKAGEVGSETATTLYSVAGGATTVAGTNDFTSYGFFCAKDHKCLVRIANSAAMSAATHSVQAGIYPWSQ